MGAGRIAPPGRGETLGVHAKPLGQYAYGAKGVPVRPLDGAPSGQRAMSLEESLFRDAVAQLWTLPDWKARLTAVTFSNGDPNERARAYRKILADAVRVFGELRPVAPDRKITVNG